MITVDVKRLIEAFEETEVFALPDMNEGTKYLYEKMYSRLARGETVKLSEINFGNFEYDDIASFSELHENIFEKSETTAYNITTELQRIPPFFSHVTYV